MRKDILTVLAAFTVLLTAGVATAAPSAMNEDSRALINADSVQEDYGLTGEGVTAAMWDFGSVGEHQDLEDVVTRDSTGVNYHATHIAGTITGDGKINSRHRGIAPDADLLSYHIESSSKSRLYSETDDAQERGAVVSQNSWGWASFDSFGNYDSYSKAYDRIAAGTAPGLERGMTVVFSAGNYGNDVDDRYTTLPGTGTTSKNSITVGAVDEDADMTHFSSWGPTDQGRMKPDLVANGQLVRSTKPGNEYGYKSGSSIAAPAVTGGVLLVNQAYKQVHGELPTPAAVRAVMYHTADDIMSEGPDYKSGWGVADIKGAVDKVKTDGSTNVVAEHTLETGETDRFTVEDTQKITLAWTDPAGKELVNDLELVVKDQNGNRYQTWKLDPSNPSSPATKGEDNLNTVEQVEVPEGAGKLTVEVRSDNLQSSQDYVLVADGEIQTGKVQNVGLEVVSPTDKTYDQNSVELRVNTQGAEKVTYSLNSGTETEMSGNDGVYTATVNAANGDNTVDFKASNGDQTVNKQVSFNVAVADTTAPEIDVVSPQRKTYRDSNVEFRIAANEGLSKAYYVIDGKEYSLQKDGDQYAATQKIDDGFHRVTFHAVDESGNRAEDSVFYFVEQLQEDTTNDSPEDDSDSENNDKVEDQPDNTEPEPEPEPDTTAPEIELKSSVNRDEVTIDYSADEELEKVWYVINDGDRNYIDGETTVTFEEGTHRLELYGTDTAGNKGSDSTAIIVELPEQDNADAEKDTTTDSPEDDSDSENNDNVDEEPDNTEPEPEPEPDQPEDDSNNDAEDTTPPKLEVESPNGGLSGDRAWFNVSVNEDVESVKVTVNRKKTYTLEGGKTYSKKLPVKKGLNTAMFMATDTSDNFASETLVFNVD